jgi:hypothetical protein
MVYFISKNDILNNSFKVHDRYSERDRDEMERERRQERERERSGGGAGREKT